MTDPWIAQPPAPVAEPVCADCNYPLHPCRQCDELIGHDGYDDHQCREGADTCMCGSPMDGHGVADNHSPVSMADYHGTADA